MMSSTAFIVTLVASGVLLAGVSIRVRDWVVGLYGGVFALVYLADGAATVDRGRLYFSQTLAEVDFDPQVTAPILFAICGAMFIMLVTYFAASRLAHRGAARLRLDGHISGTRVWLLLVPIALAALPAFAIVQEGQLRLLLQARQAVLADSILGTLALFLLPVAGCACLVVGTATSKRWRRLAVFVLAAAYFILTLFTGSRSAFLLSVVLPVLVFGFMRSSFRARRLRTSERVIVLLCGLLVLLATIPLSAWYRDTTRGMQAEQGVFFSPDITQFDALADIWSRDFRASTYASALTFFVPRSMWLDKPVSCNAAYSIVIYPLRYQTSGAEITCSVLGEAYANFGPLLVPVGGVFVGLVMAFAKAFLVAAWSSPSQMLGLIFLFRGVNAIRGDSLNTVLPLAFALLFFFVVFSRGRPVGRVNA